jgi:hypothetical protein
MRKDYHKFKWVSKEYNIPENMPLNAFDKKHYKFYNSVIENYDRRHKR